MVVTVPLYVDTEQSALVSDCRKQADDVCDTPEEMAQWPPLVANLEKCEGVIKAYRKADCEAKHVQSHHQHLYRAAAVSGTFAVLFAILQLHLVIPGSVEYFPRYGEGITAIIALAAVLFGIFGFVQKKWLGLRHKAERFRFLKFEFLIDPGLWGTNPKDRERAVTKLHNCCHKIAQVNSKDELRRELKKYAENEILPKEPTRLASSEANAYTLHSLVDYYLTKRCRSQLKYFECKSRELSRRDRYVKLLPPLLFFFSISAALAHFSLDLAQSAEITAQTAPAFDISITLILIAASLPVIGAGVRTFRSAYEPARNRSRYCAARSALKKAEEQLAQSAKRLRGTSTEGHTTIDADEVFRDLWRCEQILEAEHREWLRLMIEAEWFG